MDSFGFEEIGRLYFLIPVLAFILAGIALKLFITWKFLEFLEEKIRPIALILKAKRKWLKVICFSFLMCFVVVAFSRPIWTRVAAGAYNYLLVFDITQSMWVRDYNVNGQLLSRLDMAKANGRALLDALPSGSRLGLAVMATDHISKSSLMVIVPKEVTKFRRELDSIIRSIDYYWLWSEASSFPDSIIDLDLKVKGNPKLYGEGLVAVFLTDGEVSVSPSVSGGNRAARKPVTFADYEFAVSGLYFVGLGTLEGGVVPEYDIVTGKMTGVKSHYIPKTGERAPLISKLDESFLKNLVDKLKPKAQYRRISGLDDLSALAKEDSLKLGKAEITQDLSWIAWLISFSFFVLFLIL